MRTFLRTGSAACMISLSVFTACTKVETVDAPNRILEFKVSNVPEGKEPVYGAINDNDNTIKVYLPFYYQLPVLIPEIKTSAGATVTPGSGGVITEVFTAFKKDSAFRFTVKPANGPERVYTLNIETQQGALVLNELSTNAASPTVYTLDYTIAGTSSVSFSITGKNIMSSLDVNSLILIDQATKKEYDMKNASFSVVNNAAGISLSALIGKFNYGTTVESDMAKSLPEDALYTVKVYSYAKQATLKNPIRIIKKRA